MADVLTFAGVRAPGLEDNFSDFYETTFMETSGRSEVNLCAMALMLLRLAKSRDVLEPAMHIAIALYETAMAERHCGCDNSTRF